MHVSRFVGMHVVLLVVRLGSGKHVVFQHLAGWTEWQFSRLVLYDSMRCMWPCCTPLIQHIFSSRP
jgi:hypothetical protein